MGTGKSGFFPVPAGSFFGIVMRLQGASSGMSCRLLKIIIKLNILTIEYTKQMCYNAITSKKHSLFTMNFYPELRLKKLLAADNRYQKLVTRWNISNIQN